MGKKGFDYEECYLTFKGEVFAIAENKKNARVIGETLTQLFNENIQLKHCIKKLQNELNNYSEICNELNALVDDNEQLKKELKRCKDWINSDKNDYELTLSFIKNKGYSLKDVLEYEKELKSE